MSNGDYFVYRFVEQLVRSFLSLMISNISFLLGPRPHQTLISIFSLFGNIAFSEAVCYIDSTWGFFHSFYRLHDSAEYYCGKDALGSLQLPSGISIKCPPNELAVMKVSLP